jgi:hypothetical protein
VSCWVCIASIVKTAPARPVNPFSSFRTAGISLDFPSTATWPRTAPIPCARAGRWTPRPVRAPRPAPPAPPGRHRRPTARSRRTTSTPRSPPRSPPPAARPADAGARASSAGPGPGQGDQAGTGCGQPSWTKIAAELGGGRKPGRDARTTGWPVPVSSWCASGRPHRRVEGEPAYSWQTQRYGAFLCEYPGLVRAWQS